MMQRTRKSIVKKKIKRFLITILFSFSAIIGLIFFWFQIKYEEPAEKIITNSTTKDFRKHQNSIIYDKNGKVLTNLASDSNSKYLIYQEIPLNVKNAFVAVEDHNFYQHSGIDLKGIVRVVANYVFSAGKSKHGASTITQQLIRNTFLGKEVTMDRKLKEIAYAIALEKKYSKENILEFYINNIYFGNQQYGIESAASFYFNKTAGNLSLAETAYLCAIPNSPSYYDPIQNPKHTKKRQRKILKDMLTYKMISKEEYIKALEEKVRLKLKKQSNSYGDQATYAIYCATIQIMKKNKFNFQYNFDSMKIYQSYRKKYNQAYTEAKHELYTRGYRVYTSLDMNLQKKLQKSIDKNLSSFSKKTDGVYQMQGAGTCINNKTGKVIAIVGGRSQKKMDVQLNRAFESKRQPGSAIKPILVYGPAIDSGYHAESVLQDVNVSAYHSGMSGTPVSLENALIYSKNGAAYWLENQIGVKSCLNYLKKMKFGSIVGEDETLASSLGGLTIGTNTVEMASAYCSIYNEGRFVEPTCIQKMENSEGIGLYFSQKPQKIYKKDTAKELLKIMERVIREGTAKNLNWDPKRFAAGKTGTTNDSKDGWFCGMTDQYTLSVWVGYDRPKSNNSLWGNTYPSKIWRDFMK